MIQSVTISTLLLIFPLIFAAYPMYAATQDDAMPPDEKILSDFSGPDDVKNWRVVNDGVMGGLSQSEIIPGPDDTAIFQGVLSLENNGGFSSTRTKPRGYELGSYDTLAIRIRGDGRTYQFRLRTDSGFDGIAYRHIFTTPVSEWATINLPLKDFVAVFRGRQVKNAAPLAVDQIRQMGFLIADEKAGPFRLEIDWIKALRHR